LLPLVFLVDLFLLHVQRNVKQDVQLFAVGWKREEDAENHASLILIARALERDADATMFVA